MDVGVLLVHHLGGRLQNDVAAAAAHHPAHHLGAVDVVEHGVLAQRMAQIHADALVNLAGALVTLGHQGLHFLQLFGGGAALQLNAGAGGQLDDGVLAEVLHAAADVAAPLVPHGVGLAVHRGKGQLVQPAADVAAAVHKADGLAGAHGNAHDAILFQAHGPGQGAHVAVVGHHHGNFIAQGAAQFFRGAGVDVLHLSVKVLFAHLQEQAGHHAAVVDEVAGRGNADAVHLAALFQNFGGGGVQRGQNALIVVVGVRNGLGVPHNLFAVNGLTVDHGAHLPVRAAGVKADAGAVQMAAHALGLLEGRGLLAVRQGRHFKGALVDVGHEVAVKGAAAALAVGVGHIGGQCVVAADGHLEAAPAPQQKLHQTVHIILIRGLHLGRAVHLALPGADLAAAAFHCNAQRLGGVLFVSLEKQPQRHKAGVQHRKIFDRDFHIQKLHDLSSFPWRKMRGRWARCAQGGPAGTQKSPLSAFIIMQAGGGVFCLTSLKFALLARA